LVAQTAFAVAARFQVQYILGMILKIGGGDKTRWDGWLYLVSYQSVSYQRSQVKHGMHRTQACPICSVRSSTKYSMVCT
jgi:hypothetical protein